MRGRPPGLGSVATDNARSKDVCGTNTLKQAPSVYCGVYVTKKMPNDLLCKERCSAMNLVVWLRLVGILLARYSKEINNAFFLRFN